jgi:hypothetical protein
MKKQHGILVLLAFILVFASQSCKKEANDNNIPQTEATKLSSEITVENATTFVLSANDKVEIRKESRTSLATRSVCYTVTRLADGRYQFQSPWGDIKYWLFYNRTTGVTTAVASTIISPSAGSSVAVTFAPTTTTTYSVSACFDREYYSSCNCYSYSVDCSDDYTYNVGPALSGNYRVRNSNSNRYLVVTNGYAYNGAKVIQYDNIGQSDAEWDFMPETNGTFRIRNMNSGRFLAIDGGSLSNGANALQWQDDNQRDVYWRLISLGSNEYKIQNVNSGLYLAVLGGYTNNFAQVGQWQDVGQRDIRWFLERTVQFQTLELRSFNAYRDCNYNFSYNIAEGYYPRLPNNVPNDAISSIQSSNLRISLYEHDNFKGDCVVFRYGANINCLTTFGFNDVTSSIIAARR